jgi:hypothetical protein
MMQFAHGVLFLGYLTIALFFLRYWRRSRDRLFLFFCISFVLMATHRAFLASLDRHDEVGTWVYWVRLGSYLLILYAIFDKNLHRSRT